MKRIALLLLTAFALIASGCGGDSEESGYVDQLNTVDAKAEKAFSERPASTTARSAAKYFDTTADRLEPVVADYKAIKPPDNAKTAHAKTITGTEGLIALFREIADDFRAAKTAGEVNEIAKRTRDVSSERPFRQLEAARQDLADAGYKVAPRPGA